MGDRSFSVQAEGLARQTFTTKQIQPEQLVLKYNEQNEIKPRKFKVKWVRPFKIREVGYNGAIKLWTLDGKEVPDPVNGGNSMNNSEGK